MSRAAPSIRSHYAAFVTLPTRWQDNDEYGHLNNATYFSLFDTALSLWQLDNGIPIKGADALRFLVVENGCTYHAEAAFPDVLTAGLRIGHLGRSSFRYDIGLFANDATTACAEGFFTQVHVTGADSAPTPLPETVRATLQSLHR